MTGEFLQFDVLEFFGGVAAFVFGVGDDDFFEMVDGVWLDAISLSDCADWNIISEGETFKCIAIQDLVY